MMRCAPIKGGYFPIMAKTGSMPVVARAPYQLQPFESWGDYFANEPVLLPDDRHHMVPDDRHFHKPDVEMLSSQFCELVLAAQPDVEMHS